MCVYICVYVIAPHRFLQKLQIERFPSSRKRASGATSPRRPHGPESVGRARKVQPRTLHQYRREGRQTGIFPSVRRGAADVFGGGTCPHGIVPVFRIAVTLVRY